MATANFLSKWRAGTGTLVHLATIVLPRIDGMQTDTLRVATGDVATNSPSQVYVGAIREVGPIHHAGGFGTTDLPLCTARLRLLPYSEIIFPAGTGIQIATTVRGTLVTHRWVGAEVRLYRYFIGDPFSDAQQVFSGAVTSWELDADSLTFQLRQATDWNLPLTPRTVTRNEFPRAPDEAIGMTLPIVYGNYAAAPMRRPWPSVLTIPFISGHRYFTILSQNGGINDHFARGVMVDNGRGSGLASNPDAKVMMSGHKLFSLDEEVFGTSVWIDTGGELMGLIDTPSKVFNEDNGAGVTLPDGFHDAWIGVVPSGWSNLDFRDAPITQLALDPRNIMQPSDSGYVWFDWNAGYLDLRPIFPRMSRDLIEMEAYRVVIGYQSDASLAGLKVFAAVPGGIEPGTTLLTLAPALTPTIAFSNILAAPPGFPLEVEFPELPRYSVRFEVGAGTAKVFFFGFVVKVRPRRVLSTSRRDIGTEVVPIPNRVSPEAIFGPFVQRSRLDAVTKMEGNFYSMPQGYMDDGSDSFTGGGGNFIELAPDIIMHMLATYGEVPIASMERGPTAFGSFVKGRGDLSVPQNIPPSAIHALTISEDVDVLTAMLWLTNESMAFVTVSPYDDKFRFFVWKNNPAVDYTWKFSRADIDQPLGPAVEQTPISNVVTGIRIPYMYDARRRVQRSEVALGTDRSVAGYEYFGLRDQYMTAVSGENTWFDFASNDFVGGALVARSAFITPRSYVPQSDKAPGGSAPFDYELGLAQQWKGQMAWAEGTQATGPRYQVTWGTQITTGYNDILQMDKAGVSTQVTVPAGNYATCEALAAACVTAAVAAGITNFVCAYDRPLGKFALYTGSSSPVLKIKAGSSFANTFMQRTAWGSLGFVPVGGDITIPFGAGSAIYGDNRYEEHFSIIELGSSGGSHIQFEVRLKSGAHGSDSPTTVTHCGDLIGFRSDDNKTIPYSGNNGKSYCGDCPKNNREATMVNAAAFYGARRELAIQSRTIQDTQTALALRNRICDLFNAPRTVISFTTSKAPDIERGHVIEFDADMDGAQPYPGPGTNGSWVGKRFMVVEVVQYMGPAKLATDIVAVDLTTGVAAVTPPLGTVKASLLAGAAISCNLTKTTALGANPIPMGNVMMETV